MSVHEGGCLCGQVRFAVDAAPLDSGYCHCRMCQRNAGSPVVAWVTFPAAGFAWLAGSPRTYVSSASGRRQFCGHCGSYLVFRSTARPEEVSINTASLDHPEAFPPSRHIFVESRIPWFHTADELPRCEGCGEEAGPQA